jgi:hypothetical protein
MGFKGRIRVQVNVRKSGNPLRQSSPDDWIWVPDGFGLGLGLSETSTVCLKDG